MNKFYLCRRMLEKRILLIGAGRSASSLINFLLDYCSRTDYRLVVSDISVELASSKLNAHPKGIALALNLEDRLSLEQAVNQASVVISMAPAFLHLKVAEVCLAMGKSLFTASYLSPEMKAMAEEVEKKGLLFLNELGCDPGIDHMSALALKANIEKEGGKIVSFSSYTGGLVAPACNDNPWGYKFSWNPRNVVLAGSAGAARFIENNTIKFLPYQRLFRQVEKTVVNGVGPLDGYYNRDSVPYKALYQLKDAHTVIRGTFRYPNYCSGWNALLSLGLTDDHLILDGTGETYRNMLHAFVPEGDGSLEDRLAAYLNHFLAYQKEEISTTIDQIKWLGLFDEIALTSVQQSVAAHLQHLLEQKWVLRSDDRDLVVMQHILKAEFVGGNARTYTSTLVLEGDDAVQTAMAKTVGWPLGIAVTHYLEGRLPQIGVHIPNHPDIYLPILAQLESMGIHFMEDIHNT